MSCGVFGIVSNENVASRITLGLYDLQHRGEQGAGMAVAGQELVVHKGDGLVTEVFNQENREEILQKCEGNFGIGHVLYSTIGKTGEEKQPQTFQPLLGKFNGEFFCSLP